MPEREDGPLCAENDPPEESAAPPEDVPERKPTSGCRTELRGWAGAHLHGAVRPRRRTHKRGRPPGRWC